MTLRAEVMGKVPIARMLPCYVVRTVRAHAAIGAMACALALSAGCESRTERAAPSLPIGMQRPKATNATATPPAIPFDTMTPRVIARAVTSWPHDTSAYTQGLLLTRGRLLESTGLEGQSQLREIDRRSGRVLHRTVLPASSFGEGIAVHGERLFQLTWQDERGFTYDATSLSPVDSFTYTGEGWGLTSDGRRLYLSDGSSRIRVLVPSTMTVEYTIEVKEAGRAVWMLNELEWIRGELWANIYQTSWIARIDPSTGVVLGWVDTSELLTSAERADVAARGGTANGIAYDSVSNRVLLTGKRWPTLFEVDLRKLASKIGQAP